MTEHAVELICLVAGPVIAALVQAAKALSFVQRYPKIVAFALSTLTAVVSGFAFGGLDWQAIATCTLVPFTASIATYEVVVKSAEKHLV